ncbi:unnamed protein product [Paramecium sonneborni]|uniref:WD40-repeat-containing domain n=1 Tax=Paramecium sonneborni TaxID=65129 RepID=A0A8S1Q234_9CILI|nr:unnamed protein product [Paramecium sonneborni]
MEEYKLLDDLKGIQCYFKHKNPQNFYVLFDKTVKGKDKIRCEQCIKYDEKNAIELVQILEEFNQEKNSQHDQLSEMVVEKIKMIEQLQSKITNLKTCVIQKFDSFLNFSFDQKDFLVKLIKEKEQFNFDQFFDYLDDKSQIAKNSKKDMMKIMQTERGMIDKLEISYKQIMEMVKKEQIIEENYNKITQSRQDINALYQSRILSQKTQEDISYNNQINQQKLKYRLLQEIKQSEFCYSMTFNQDETLLAAGFSNSIKLWKFNMGQLTQHYILLQGKSDIDIPTCLTFSKKSNDIYSGSYSGQINFWREINQNRWEIFFTSTIHQGLITCLILNQKEDEIITSGSDKLIIVLKNNQQEKKVSQYELKQHQKVVFSISLNQSETQLVSSSLDQQLIIWEKNSKQIYEFKYVIQKSINDFGHRVCFLNDNFIVWQQNKDGTTHVFQKENGRFKQKPENKIVLDHSEGEDGQFLFPIIYNKEKQILILKYSNSIYIFKNHEDQQFKLEAKINCSSNSIYGCMTKDSKYLIYWDCSLQLFNIQEFNYQ